MAAPWTLGIAAGVIGAIALTARAAPVLDPTTVPAKPTPEAKASKTAAAKLKKQPKKAKRAKAKKARRKVAKRTKRTRGKPAKVIATTAPAPSTPANRSVVLSPTDDVTATPAYRYGTLESAACLAELATRKIAYRREGATLGIVTPVRLTGPIRGIEIRSNQSAQQRETSRWEIADCRLVVALDDFAQILTRHDVVEVRHYSMYRNPPTSFSAGDVATRHPGGLALDAARFVRRDGSYLDVAEHYHGRIGQRSCGDGADPPRPATPEAVAIRSILCEVAAAKLFNVVLTPNHDRPHHNHFHLEVTPSVKWFLVK